MLPLCGVLASGWLPPPKRRRVLFYPAEVAEVWSAAQAEQS